MNRSLFSCSLEKDVKGENQLEKRVNGEINFPASHAPITKQVPRATSSVMRVTSLERPRDVRRRFTVAYCACSKTCKRGPRCLRIQVLRLTAPLISPR